MLILGLILDANRSELLMVKDELLMRDANTNLIESHSFAVLVKSRQSFFNY